MRAIAVRWWKMNGARGKFAVAVRKTGGAGAKNSPTDRKTAIFAIVDLARVEIAIAMGKMGGASTEIAPATGKMDGKTALFAFASTEIVRKMAAAAINSATVQPCSGAYQISSPTSPPRSCFCSV